MKKMSVLFATILSQMELILFTIDLAFHTDTLSGF
jgi:hypothetical protein